MLKMSWKRCQQNKLKLVNIYNRTKYLYGRGVWYDEDKDRYYRYYISGHGGHSNYANWLKKQSRRKYRRCNKYNYPTNSKAHYRKAFDLWWELF